MHVIGWNLKVNIFYICKFGVSRENDKWPKSAWYNSYSVLVIYLVVLNDKPDGIPEKLIRLFLWFQDDIFSLLLLEQNEGETLWRSS